MCRKLRKEKIYDRREGGFSLVELFISLVVFLIFISAIYGLLRIGALQKNAVNKQTEVIKNARLSLNTIGRDAVNAGFGYSRAGGLVPDNLTNLRMGLPADADVSHDLLTSIITGDEIDTNTLLATGKTDVVSFAYRDITFNSGEPIEFVGAADYGGNGVTITTADGDTVNSRPYDLYLISDGARTTLALVTNVPGGDKTLIFETGGSDPLGINAPYNGSVDVASKLRSCSSPTENGCFDYSNRITAKKITWVSYGVDSNATLVRTSYGNNTNQSAANQIQLRPIAYKIQNLQIRYLMRNGTITDDPSAGGTDPTNLNNVVQMDVVITASVTMDFNGVKTEKLVDLRSTFSTKNLNYDIG